ncbi:MAG: DsrE family protein [Desulfotignum sp.]|nr:DsrE family protein [Desulfotignum sp.]
MKITILLKSGPSSIKAQRVIQVAADMMSQGDSVHLHLLQDAVHLSRSTLKTDVSTALDRLIDQGLDVSFLTQDAELRGLDVSAVPDKISGGTYDTLVDLMTSSDRVIGLL